MKPAVKIKNRPRRKKPTIGLDEVGRGCLAGPVAVAAAMLLPGFRIKPADAPAPLRDSKKLTALQREAWFRYLSAHPKLVWSVSYVNSGTIDKINIAKAANLAALRSFRKIGKVHERSVRNADIYLDGGLYLGNGRGRLSADTSAKADERIDAVKIASILAKVRRDRYMARTAAVFPGYGFEAHKGYGTKAHLLAIKKMGISDIHRRSFLGDYI